MNQHPETWDEMTSTEKASFYRAEIMEHLRKVVQVLNDADNNKIIIAFNINRDSYGQFKVAELSLSKVL